MRRSHLTKPLITLYGRIISEKNNQDIIYKTKNLALNNEEYSKYVDTYENSTQLSSFKEPNTSSYPLFRNLEYISLQRLDNQTYEHSFKGKLQKKINKNKFKKLFLGAEINKIKTKTKTQTDFNCELETQGNTILNTIEKIKKNEEEKIDHHNLFLLCELLFKEEYYKDCIYNEKKIFNHIEEYETYLKNKLVFMKGASENRLNTTSNLSHSFLNKRYGKIDLILNSINIEIIKENEENKKLKIGIPFDYTPSFYLCTYDELKQILLGLIIIDKEKKNYKFQLNFFENYWINIFDNYGEIIHYKNLFKSFRDIDIIGKIQIPASNDSYQYFMKQHEDEYYSEENLSIENVYDWKFRDVYNKKFNTSIFNSNISHFEIEIFYNNDKYIASIIMPSIELKLYKFGKNLVEFLDKELFVFCLQEKFINWDFIVTRYLFSLKRFRICISKLLSKTQANYSYFKNLIYIYKNNIKFFTLRSEPLKIYKFSENDFSYSFILTDSKSEKNNLFKILPYSINVYYYPINQEKIFSFYFTLKQMKILYYVSKRERLESFILKLIHLNPKSKKLELDYSYFNIFNNFTNERIKEYLEMFEKRVKINSSYNLTDNKPSKITKETFQVIIIKPHFESIRLKDIESLSNLKDNNMIYSCTSNELSDKMLNQLVNNEIENWPKIIQDFNINLEDMYNSNNSILNRDKTITYYFTKFSLNSNLRRNTIFDKNGVSKRHQSEKKLTAVAGGKKAFSKSKTILNLKK